MYVKVTERGTELKKEEERNGRDGLMQIWGERSRASDRRFGRVGCQQFSGPPNKSMHNETTMMLPIGTVTAPICVSK
jgi:hypothetical protein